MIRRVRGLSAVALWALGALVACAVPEVQAGKVLPPRAGQVGLGLQGQIGTLLESGKLGEEFGSGGGIAVRVRYRMRYERALGLSFESQSFDARNPADSLGAITKATLVTSGAEFYQLFGTRTVTHKMLSVGIGLVQVSQDTNDSGTVFPGDGLYVSAGAGLERFFWNSWAFDLSSRYMTLFQEGKTNHDFQVSLGLIFYASY
jgi:Outer membrane protein beta-barrel domain